MFPTCVSYIEDTFIAISMSITTIQQISSSKKTVIMTYQIESGYAEGSWTDWTIEDTKVTIIDA